MTKVIIASVIMASVTIMASITYGKCDLWQVLLMTSVTYGKSIMSSVIMATILWQLKLSLLITDDGEFPAFQAEN